MSQRVFLRKAKQINLRSEISRHSTTSTHTEHWFSLNSRGMNSYFHKIWLQFSKISRRAESSSTERICYQKYLRVCTFAIVQKLSWFFFSTQQHLIYEFLIRERSTEGHNTTDDWRLSVLQEKKLLFLFAKQEKIFKTCSNVDSDECGVFTWKIARSGQRSLKSEELKAENGFLSICLSN